MSQPFKDHFSSFSAEYTRYRPAYPNEVFAWLASLTQGHSRAWDCGTGGGQAAALIASHFSEVFATDASAQQIASAKPVPGVNYVVAPAEDSGLPSQSVDLINVAQAAHWFQLERFYAEVRRVAAPGAVLSLLGYGLFAISPDLDAIVQTLYADVVGQDWPPERAHMDHAYRDLNFPFREITFPHFAMGAHWNAHEVLGYLGTWSAVRAYQRRTGQDAIDVIRQPFLQAWGGPPESARAISWPLFGRVGVIA